MGGMFSLNRGWIVGAIIVSRATWFTKCEDTWFTSQPIQKVFTLAAPSFEFYKSDVFARGSPSIKNARLNVKTRFSMSICPTRNCLKYRLIKCAPFVDSRNAIRLFPNASLKKYPCPRMVKYPDDLTVCTFNSSVYSHSCIFDGYFL